MAEKRRQRPAVPEKEETEPFEEYRGISMFWSWTLIVVLCAAILLWGLMNYALVRDTPRQWDFGILPDAPGQSIYSSAQTPRKGPAPPQLAPLPEARPLTPAAAPASAPAPTPGGQGGSP